MHRDTVGPGRFDDSLPGILRLGARQSDFGDIARPSFDRGEHTVRVAEGEHKWTRGEIAGGQMNADPS
jgi:hypothetical protein